MKKHTPLLVSALMALLSLAGLLFQGIFYPTQALQRAFVSNDVVNLLIGLPTLLISHSLARRENLLGVLLDSVLKFKFGKIVISTCDECWQYKPLTRSTKSDAHNPEPSVDSDPAS